MSDDTPSGMKIDPALVRELAELLSETGLTEIEVEDGSRKIRVARKLKEQVVAAPFAPPPAPAPTPVATPTAPAASAEVGAADLAAKDAVPSPMVGTAYLAAEPGAAPFAGVGATVAAGDTILIIEAMKVMNPIIAPRAGTLTAMLVENGQPVEYDQPLFVIA